MGGGVSCPRFARKGAEPIQFQPTIRTHRCVHKVVSMLHSPVARKRVIVPFQCALNSGFSKVVAGKRAIFPDSPARLSVIKKTPVADKRAIVHFHCAYNPGFSKVVAGKIGEFHISPFAFVLHGMVAAAFHPPPSPSHPSAMALGSSYGTGRFLL